jgi:hypothetical protein
VFARALLQQPWACCGSSVPPQHEYQYQYQYTSCSSSEVVCYLSSLFSLREQTAAAVVCGQCSSSLSQTQTCTHTAVQGQYLQEQTIGVLCTTRDGTRVFTNSGSHAHKQAHSTRTRSSRARGSREPHTHTQRYTRTYNQLQQGGAASAFSLAVVSTAYSSSSSSSSSSSRELLSYSMLLLLCTHTAAVCRSALSLF